MIIMWLIPLYVLFLGLCQLAVTRTVPAFVTVDEINLDNKLTPKRASKALSPFFNDLYINSVEPHGQISDPYLSPQSKSHRPLLTVFPDGPMTSTKNVLFHSEEVTPGTHLPSSTERPNEIATQTSSAKTEAVPSIPVHRSVGFRANDSSSTSGPSADVVESLNDTGTDSKVIAQLPVTGQEENHVFQDVQEPSVIGAKVDQSGVGIKEKLNVKTLNNAADPVTDHATKTSSLLNILSKALYTMKHQKADATLISGNDIVRWYLAPGINRVKSRSVSGQSPVETTTPSAATVTTTVYASTTVTSTTSSSKSTSYFTSTPTSAAPTTTPAPTSAPPTTITTTTATTTTTTATTTTTTATTTTTTATTTTTTSTTTTTPTTTTAGEGCSIACALGVCPPSCVGRFDGWNR